MADNTLVTPAAPSAPRPRYRPPLGLPLKRDSRWGQAVSFLLHALLILFILAPLFEHDVELVAERGAGGAGPAGGGGGGRRGSGGESRPEALRFFAAPPAPPPAATPLVAPQIQQPLPPPPPPPPPDPIPVIKTDVAVEAPPSPNVTAPNPGLGGGTGNDGTAGTGPGTGGGVGTGVGTGKGSANGPGTGGEGGSIYPASPETMLIPPIPVPRSVSGKTLQLLFSLDERGKVLRIEFSSSGDRSYDKQLRAKFLEYKFRPAHKGDGTPVASVYPFEVTL
jgi:hypothetical protein